jgi:hypothetical protein
MFHIFALLCTEWIGARHATYKYFMISEDYSEVDIKDPIVVSCQQYGLNITRQFLDDFVGPHPVALIHAWKRTNDRGDFYACEVMRLRVRYLITVNIPDGSNPDQKFLHSVRILNEETPTGAHWFEPEEEMRTFVLDAVKEKYGTVTLKNVAVFKTYMKVKWVGQMVIDVLLGKERALLDVTVVKPFGAKNHTIESIKRIY